MIAQTSRKIAAWYRAKRWVRWPVDVVVVLLMILVIAAVHALPFGTLANMLHQLRFIRGG